MKKKLLLFSIFPLFLIFNKSLADGHRIIDWEAACTYRTVEKYARSDYIISTRQLMNHCGCYANKKMSGRSTWDCPGIDAVTGYEMRQRFTGFD